MGLYKIVEDIDNKSLFLYIAMMLFSLYYFMKIDIRLNIILAIFIGTVVVAYVNEKRKTGLQIEEEQMEKKLEEIKPAPQYFENHKDIIDFLFSVQDYYNFNPEAYEECIDNMDAFMRLHDIILEGTDLCDDYYQIAESKKNNALNAFHSILFKLPNNKLVTEKFNRAHKRLETIMTDHLGELYDVCTNEVLLQGYNNNRKAINIGPKPANHYFDRDYTYQIY